ncbi:MAG: 4Fe-4S dicluster domain-containing protein [Pseudomonadota bacterium]
MEALPPSAARTLVAGGPCGRAARLSERCGRAQDQDRLPWSARVRPCLHRHHGHRLGRRHPLQGPARGDTHHRRELRAGGGHVLLHLHGNRARRHGRSRSGADGADRRSRPRLPCGGGKRRRGRHCKRPHRQGRNGRGLGARTGRHATRRRGDGPHTQHRWPSRRHRSGSGESQHWQEVADRCLTCGNCTMVCPTCYCTEMSETTDLTGNHAERWRSWESCFSLDFSHVTSGSVRHSPASRYRQWLTHKLSAWVDQFGTMGCVGCGRCITWCPVGIDITEEATALAEEVSS